MSSLGKEVRRRRRALGLTLEALAERADLSPHYLSTVETEKRDPSVSTVLALARALDVAPGELFGTSKTLSPAAVEAGRMYDDATPDVREAVTTLLRAVTRRRR